MNAYLLLKWVHVLMAITALGTNLTYGVWLTRAAREAQHLGFALRGLKILDDRIANPAYGVIFLTGMAMVYVGKVPWAPWMVAGLILYVLVVVIAAAVYTPTLRRLIASLDAGGPQSTEYQRLAARGTRLGILLSVIVVIIVFLMVTKPALWG